MVRNGIFWTIGEQLHMVYYPIISYLKIKVYRAETMYMGRSQWRPVDGTGLEFQAYNVKKTPYNDW